MTAGQIEREGVARLPADALVPSRPGIAAIGPGIFVPVIGALFMSAARRRMRFHARTGYQPAGVRNGSHSPSIRIS